LAGPTPIYQASPPSVQHALRQGEILTNLIQIHLDLQTIGLPEPRVTPRRHEYALVLSQDCDLDLDFKARAGTISADKLIPCVLFCEVITAQELRFGPGGMNSTIWGNVRANKHERYQFLQKVEPTEDCSRKGFPELGIDFKRYFTIQADEVYRRIELGEAQRRCVLSSPYLEHLCRRFANYLRRVALPLDHLSE